MQDFTQRRALATTAFDDVVEFIEARLHDELETVQRVLAELERTHRPDAVSVGGRVVYAPQRAVVAVTAKRQLVAHAVQAEAAASEVLGPYEAGVAVGTTYAFRMSMIALASAYAWHSAYRPQWAL